MGLGTGQPTLRHCCGECIDRYCLNKASLNKLEENKSEKSEKVTKNTTDYFIEAALGRCLYVMQTGIGRTDSLIHSCSGNLSRKAV